jgi:hypothetical protein
MLRLTAEYEHNGAIKSLSAMREEKPYYYVKSVDSANWKDYAMIQALIIGHAEIVRLLFERKEESPELYRCIDPAARNNGLAVFIIICGPWA